jgi:FG-GAP-like repeat/Abnormal spindle-like microcephaly-assoc'd, ASPM-SPD-2-Hydin
MGASVRTACVVAALLALACCGLPLFGQTPNPVPLVNNPLSPTSVAPGGPGFTLTVNGTGFVSGATIKWNGTALTTTFVSGSQLTATVPATNIATAATATIIVSNPPPGGGTSNVVFFDISSPVSTLTFSTSYNFAGGPYGMIAADFNGDGKLDLAAMSLPTGATNNLSVSVQLGNGDGSFQMPVNYPLDGNGGAVSIVAADFNGDGKLDIAVLNIGGCGVDVCANTISVLLGNGDGTFQPQTAYPTALGAQFLLVGDFNRDGKLDLATGNNSDIDLNNYNGLPTVSVFLGNGDGTFQSHVDYPIGNNVTTISAMVAGDFNGDGNLDLACMSYDAKNVAELSVLLGNGDGSFQPATQTSLPAFGLSLIAADVNGDGKLDLVSAVNTSPNGVVYVFLGNGDGSFQPGVSYMAGDGPAVVAAADINADGKLDLVVASDISSAVSILPGNGDGTFQSAVSFPASFPGAQANVSPSLVIGDFNGDGRIDLAVLNTSNVGLLNDSLTVLLQGSFPAALLTPLFQQLGEQAVGSTSPPQTVTLTNTGNATLTISSIGTSGTNAAEFATTSMCGASLAPSASCQISVTLTPTVQGSPSAKVTVSDNGPGSPQTMEVAGSTPVAPVLVPAPSSVSFPNQYVGTSGLPQTVTITNTGLATLTITAVTAGPADFGVLSNCSNPVPVGSSCTVGVFFDPTAGGTRTGTLTLTDNAAGSPQTVALTGSGLDFSVTPGAAASATVTAGQTASYAIAVAPAGGFAASVALSCSGGPAGSACAVSPSTIALSGSAAQTAMVTVTTAAHGWLLPFRAGWPTDARYRQTPMILTLAALFLLMVVASQFLRGERNFTWVRVLGFAALVTLGLTLTSCGGGSGSSGGGTNPQAGTYTVTVTGNFTSGATTLNHSTKLTLIVQ